MTQTTPLDWLTELPEVGSTVTRRISEWQDCEEKIMKLRETIKSLRKQQEWIVRSAEKQVSGDWTKEEIQAAKEAR